MERSGLACRLATVAAMSSAVRPASAYIASGAAWSMKRSGRVIVRTASVPSSKPSPAIHCSTIAPKPPTLPCSRVTSARCVSASRRISAWSSGLAKRASASVTLRPFASSSATALRASPRCAPKLRMATSVPSWITRPRPISSGVPTSGISTPSPSPRG